MFDRFTDRSRTVMSLARRAALELGHDSIAPGHILIAIIREGTGVGAVALRQLGVSLPALEQDVRARLKSQDSPPPPATALPFTKVTADALERVARLADIRGERVIGDHVLFAVLMVDDVVRESLARHGATLQVLRKKVRELMGGTPLVGVLATPTARAVTLAQILAATNVSVFIRGTHAPARLEIARTLHEGRRQGKLIVEDCAKVDGKLREAELVGHWVGSFVGGQRLRHGLLERAKGGTLFLDQVDALPLDLQKRLAEILEKGEFTPIGEIKPVRLDNVRIVAGSSLDMSVVVAQGRFHFPLFVKLASAVIDLTKTGQSATPTASPPAAAVVPPPEPEQDRTRPLFDRLSRRSDKVLEAAREEARRLGHGDVGAEHLVFGIAREGSGLAAIVLLELLSDLGKIPPAVAAARQPGAPPIALGFAPSAQAALDTADEVAQDLERDTVDPEHILIGIARDLEESAAILRTLGLDPSAVEARVRIRLAAV